MYIIPQYNLFYKFKKCGDFPGGPVVKTLPSRMTNKKINK